MGDELFTPYRWCDETYVRVGGTWAYLYRAIDEHGQVVDIVLRTHRDLASARAFFVLATYRRRAAPEEIITDKHPAYVRAIREEVCNLRSGNGSSAGLVKAGRPRPCDNRPS